MPFGRVLSRLAGRGTVAAPVAAGHGLPDVLAAFLSGHHVLSLAVADADGPWAASCFYAFDAAAVDLIVLSSRSTRHGRAMAERPAVAGTIAGQPIRIADIEGVQFTARAEALAGIDRETALALYQRRHPMAALTSADVWRLSLRSLKHTANRVAFGRKTHWARPEA